MGKEKETTGKNNHRNGKRVNTSEFRNVSKNREMEGSNPPPNRIVNESQIELHRRRYQH